jgi:hypothetical protein
MPRYAELTDEEVSAAYAYLRTVPPVLAVRKRASAAGATSPQEGVYRKYGCNACHGLDGVGNADLRRATEHYPSDAELEAWIRHPSRLKPGTRMPDYEGIIASEDFPALVQHVRTLAPRTPR